MFVRWTTILGRSSLFVFVLQFFVYYVVIFLLRLPFTPWWPLYYLASIAVIAVAARVWYVADCNRFVTVRAGDIAAWARAHFSPSPPVTLPAKGDA
jgi:hypothetical protein